VNLPVASYQGGLLTSQGDARREAWDLFERRLGLCRQLGIGTVVVACDAAPPLAQQDIDRAVMSFQQIAESAAKREVRIAMEIQANAAFGNNLQTVAALVQSVGSPYLGVCLDLFHLWCGPSKLEDLQLLTPANLFHVQLCDLADKARELAADADRILPGDGDLPIAAVVRHLEAIGYTGHVSVELMNPMIWQIPAAQFGEVAMTALRKVLGQADMGGG